MRLLLSLLQAAAIVFVLFHLYARSPAFRPVRLEAGFQPRAKLSLYVFFSGVCILGTWLGQTLSGGAIANTRAMGAVLAGLLGGPWLGGAVAVTAGVHRLSLGGFTAPGGVAATLLEGLAAGLVHRAFVRRGASERVISWRLALGVTALGEVVHMLILLAVARPFDEAVAVVKLIGGPMIAANSAISGR